MKKPSQPPERRLTTARLPEDVLLKLQAVAAVTAVSQNHILVEALEPVLDKKIRQAGIEKAVSEFVKARRCRRSGQKT